MGYSFEKIKTIVLELPEKEQLILMKLIEEKLETKALMKLAETGFKEWNDPEEDIYNDMETYKNHFTPELERLTDG